MGYYACGGGPLIIKKENLHKVFNALLEFKPEWLIADGCDECEAFGWVGLEVEVEPDGSISSAYYEYEKLDDDLDAALGKIAPFVENGSHIDMRGEDDSLWRWRFHNQELYELKGVVIYPEDPESET